MGRPCRGGCRRVHPGASDHAAAAFGNVPFRKDLAPLPCLDQNHEDLRHVRGCLPRRGGMPASAKMRMLAVSFSIMCISAILVQKAPCLGCPGAVAVFLLLSGARAHPHYSRRCHSTQTSRCARRSKEEKARTSVVRPRCRRHEPTSICKTPPGFPDGVSFAKRMDLKNWRFENCGRLRAFFRPYFLRSTTRASRVRKPPSLARRGSRRLEQSTGNAVTQSAGLTRDAAAVDTGDDVEVIDGVRHLERGLRIVEQSLTAEILWRPRDR